MDVKPIHGISFILVCACLVLCVGCGRKQAGVDALPFQETEGGLWGLMATDGSVEFPAGSFVRQPSVVVNGMFSMPNGQGFYQLYSVEHPTQPVTNRRFAHIGHFFEEVTLAQEFPHSPIQMIDRKGRTVGNVGLVSHYDIVLAHNFSEERALICTRQGKYGFLDTKGKAVVPPMYDQAYDFHEGVALVGTANEEGAMSYLFIDKEGNVCGQVPVTSGLIDSRIGCGRMKYTSLQTGQCGYLDWQGEDNLFLADSICEAFRFQNGAAVVRSDYGAGLIDQKGKLLIAPSYREIRIVGDDRVSLHTDGGCKLADFKGKTLGAQDYERIGSFYPSRLAVARQSRGDVWMDREGRTIGRSYYRILEDSTACQLLSQIFVRRSREEGKPGGKPSQSVDTESEKTDTVSFVASKPASTEVAIRNDDWKRIGKQSPFYAEAQKIVSGRLAETDADNRRMILNYVEHLRSSYTTKDIDFLNQVFSEKALIIVGRVVHDAPQREGNYLPKSQVEYNVKSKRAYLDRLKELFRRNKEIQLHFSDFKIMRHPTQEGLYGVTLRQKYHSDLYSDDGYLFLLWDFRDKTAPLIHVRTWQPAMLDNHQPLPEDEVFQISNFNLQ